MKIKTIPHKFLQTTVPPSLSAMAEQGGEKNLVQKALSLKTALQHQFLRAVWKNLPTTFSLGSVASRSL